MTVFGTRNSGPFKGFQGAPQAGNLTILLLVRHDKTSFQTSRKTFFPFLRGKKYRPQPAISLIYPVYVHSPQYHLPQPQKVRL